MCGEYTGNPMYLTLVGWPSSWVKNPKASTMRHHRFTIRSLMLVIAITAVVSAIIIIVPSWTLLVVSLCLLIGAVVAPLAWFTIRHVSPKGPSFYRSVRDVLFLLWALQLAVVLQAAAPETKASTTG